MKFRLPQQKQHLFSPLLVISLALLLFAFEPHSSRYLEFFRTEISEGQWWRLLTGNWLHTNFAHVLLNCGGVLLVWLLHAEHYSVKHYFAVLLFCCVGSSLGLYFFDPLEQYAGLSGALHGMLFYGACRDAQCRYNESYLLMIGIVIKVVLENIYGPVESSSELIGADVAVGAHLWGLVSGMVLGLIPLWQSIQGHRPPLPGKSANK